MINLKNLLLEVGVGALLGTSAFGQGTAFSYQGRLNSASGPATGSYDLTFTLFNTNATGLPASITLTNTATAVSNGLFFVSLDFGGTPYISGHPLWLEIGARTNGADSFSTLAPRQAVLSTPYAYYAFAVNASSLIGQVTDANLSATLSSPHAFTSAGNSFTGNGSGLTGLNASYLTTGTVADALLSANVALRAGGNTFTGNQLIASGKVGIGTTTPQLGFEVDSPVYGQPAAQFDVANCGGPCAQTDYQEAIRLWNQNGNGQVGLGFLVGPGSFNSNAIPDVWIGTQYSAYGQGNDFKIATRSSATGTNLTDRIYLNGTTGGVGIGTTSPNTALQVNGTVTATSFTGDGSGLGNVALLNHGNTFTAQQIFEVNDTDYGCLVTDGTNRLGAYIGSGQCSFGTISDHALGFFVNNGFDSLDLNTNGCLGIGTSTPVKLLEVAGSVPSLGVGASVDPSVLLRLDNNASDGSVNTPDVAGIGFGHNSTRQAIVGGTYGNDYLAFYTGGALTAPKVFIADNGEVGIGNTSPQNLLDVSGEINCTAINITSDRNAKEDFAALDPRDVLAKVTALPITEWQYKAGRDRDGAGARHIGPMAQDFSAAFALGHDDKHISVVDEGGVALAAIQGLNQKLEETRAENAELKQTVSELKSLVEQLTRNVSLNQGK